ncbi:MAG: holo-ACP synthase [Clostridia bacterium]|nr:holo-ACP synthase [Clostridia bacterium]
MITGIGCDLSEIGRWEDDDARLRLTGRWFCPEEREYILARGKAAAQSAAGIFCAKEALVKALGTGFPHVSPLDVCVLHTPGGAPYYRLSGTAAAQAERAGAGRFHLSISHDGGIAAAFCVAETAQTKEDPCP